MTTTHVLGVDAVAAVVGDVGLDELLDQLIDRLVLAFDDFEPEATVTHDRAGFHYDKPELGLLEWMPAHELGRLVAIKTVGYHPTNPVQRGLPSVLATTSLHDTTTGGLVALCEATVLTALRTGAASAVATDLLAVPGPITLGVIGAGAQAVTQIHAISRVRTIERVLVADVAEDVAESLAERCPVDGIPFSVVEVPDILRSADVLCTCTSVDPHAGPVLQDGEHLPWLHVNAVGADFPGKTELPRSLLDRALVCPDITSQCLLEGESQQLDAAALGPDLATLVKQRATYRASRDRLTVFDSTGWSLEDLVAAELLLEHATRLGVGTEVDLQAVSGDPYDPYAALW